MTKRKILMLVVLAALIATLAFIWSNSLLTEQASSAASAAVLEAVKPLTETFCNEEQDAEHLIRKTAHFVEYGALGCELALLVVLCGRPRFQTVMNGLFAGLAAAVVDEALQLLSDRGAMVGDILLDFSGVAAGTALVLFICFIHAAFRNRN